MQTNSHHARFHAAKVEIWVNQVTYELLILEDEESSERAFRHPSSEHAPFPAPFSSKSTTRALLFAIQTEGDHHSPSQTVACAVHHGSVFVKTKSL
jgi:hypothetical protein